MTARILLIAAAVAWVTALAGLVWMMDAAELRAHELPLMLIHLDPVILGFVLASGLMGAIGVAGALARDPARIQIGAGDAVVCGVAGALLVEYQMRTGLICINPPIPFAYDAVNHTQALMVLLTGLTGTVVSLGVLTLRPSRVTASPLP